jgi:hypothetical protein
MYHSGGKPQWKANIRTIAFIIMRLVICWAPYRLQRQAVPMNMKGRKFGVAIVERSLLRALELAYGCHSVEISNFLGPPILDSNRG